MVTGKSIDYDQGLLRGVILFFVSGRSNPLSSVAVEYGAALPCAQVLILQRITRCRHDYVYFLQFMSVFHYASIDLATRGESGYTQP